MNVHRRARHVRDCYFYIHFLQVLQWRAHGARARRARRNFEGKSRARLVHACRFTLFL